MRIAYSSPVRAQLSAVWSATADQLTGVTVTRNSTTLGEFNYNFNGLSGTLAPGRTGARTGTSGSLNGNSFDVAFSYDPLFRLTKENRTLGTPTGVITYDASPGYGDGNGFDKVGNRRSRTATGSVATPVPAVAGYSYDVNDRLTSDTYDANGNTTASGGYTYTYDFENRLITRNGSPALSFDYDHDGHRVRKTVDGVVTYFLVDEKNPTGYAQVAEELSAVGANPIVSKVYAHGLRLISQRQGSTTQYYAHDGQGSVRFLLNDDGTVAQTYAYDAFGILIEPAAPPSGNEYLYTGEQFDRHLGMYYLRARYYHPDKGRFWNMDSFEGNPSDPISLHKYVYCHEDPVNRIDPSGQEGYYIGTTASAAIITTLFTLAFSPGVANAPGPGDNTISDSGALALAENIGGAFIGQALIRHAIGPALAKLWRVFKPKQRVKLLKVRYAHVDQYSGTAVRLRSRVAQGMDDGYYTFVVDQNRKMWAARLRNDLHHNSLVPADEGVLAAGNLRISGRGTKASANAGSGHFNGFESPSGWTSGDAKDFVEGVKELLESLGFEVEGVSGTQYFPGAGP